MKGVLRQNIEHFLKKPYRKNEEFLKWNNWKVFLSFPTVFTGFCKNKSMMEIINMILFQVSLNFDPVKEILKLQCDIYILMNKVIILRKIQVTMKTFAPPFSTIGRNLTYSRFICWFIIYNIRIRNLGSCKCELCKNEAREICGLSCRGGCNAYSFG